MRGLGLSLAVVLLLNAQPVLAQKQISLPIAQGLWVNAPGNCATASNGYLYDGARWGAVYYYGPNGSMGPVAELEKIGHTMPLNDGFTNMQLGETEGVGYFHVKSLGADRMIVRIGALGPEGIQVMDETMVRCSFATLSPKMRAAIKRFAPTLAR